MNYKLTKNQQEAIDSIESFLVDETTPVCILKGYAGTGKTTLIGMLVAKCLTNKRNYKLSAPTGRAARILNQKTGFPATTIHSMIYSYSKTKNIHHEKDAQDNEEELIYYFSVKSNEDVIKTVYIVDESSMISDQDTDVEHLRFGSGCLLSDLMEYAQLTGTNINSKNKHKIIFVGDTAQLPPVKSQHSPALTKDYISTQYGLPVLDLTLTEVVRQSEMSTILLNATRIRESIENKQYNNFNIESGADVVDTKTDYLSHWTLDYHIKNQHPLIIASTNAKVLEYNVSVRDKLFPDSPTELCVGDRIIVVANNMMHQKLNGDLGTIKEINSQCDDREIKLNWKDEVVGQVFFSV